MCIQKWQLIVWRRKSQDQLQYEKLTTLAPGTASASYLAIKVLHSLADQQKNGFPVASIIAKRDFNLGNVLTGAEDLEQANQLQNELIEMLKSTNMS